MFCQQLELSTKGPADTLGDGECLFRALSQAQAVVSRGSCWAMTHSTEAQSGYLEARSIAAAEIRDNGLIQAGIVEYAAQIASDNRFQGAKYADALLGHDATMLPGLIADRIAQPVTAGEVKEPGNLE